MNGLIDEVSIYDRALSQTEVRSLTNTLPALIPGSFGGQLPSTTALAVSAGAIFDLGGNSQTVASLADNAGGGTITNSGAAPVTLTLGGGSGTNIFSGVIADNAASNAVSLVKNGTAVEILAGANHFRGTTTVNNETLIVNGSLGTNSVSVNGGTLGGNGLISGPVTINSGGVFAPGNPFGALTISNNLTLAAGSTTFVPVQHWPLTNAVVNISGTLAEGGTLIVTNSGATALAAGDSFNVFNAASYQGAFSNVVLPLLPAGLAWNTNRLNAAGALSVVVATKPVIGSIGIASNGLVFSGAAGVANADFYLLTSTNLAAPVSNWTRLLTNQFEDDGDFNFTNPLTTTSPISFYLLQLQ